MEILLRDNYTYRIHEDPKSQEDPSTTSEKLMVKFPDGQRFEVQPEAAHYFYIGECAVYTHVELVDSGNVRRRIFRDLTSRESLSSPYFLIADYINHYATHYRHQYSLNIAPQAVRDDYVAQQKLIHLLEHPQRPKWYEMLTDPKQQGAPDEMSNRGYERIKYPEEPVWRPVDTSSDSSAA